MTHDEILSILRDVYQRSQTNAVPPDETLLVLGMCYAFISCESRMIATPKSSITFGPTTFKG